jgi:hypothetical protein
MTHLLRITLPLATLLLALLASGCGGRDCTSYCTEAQSKSCTSIKGNCSSFCNAAESLGNEASCQSQRDSYFSCLESGDTCETSARCAGQENALGTCVAAWCLKNPSNANCVTVKAALW